MVKKPSLLIKKTAESSIKWSGWPVVMVYEDQTTKYYGSQWVPSTVANMKTFLQILFVFFLTSFKYLIALTNPVIVVLL